MKKIYLALLISVSALLLVACGGKIRAQDPIITAKSTSFTIDIGEDFDPLQGITAKDPVKDITDRLTHDLDMSLLNRPGSISYNVSVKNDAGLSATIVINLVVGSPSLLQIDGPSAVSHYVGGKEFDPLLEIVARDINNPGREVPVEVTGEYSTEIPGTYSYTVTAGDLAIDNALSTKNVVLTVRPDAEIPNELSKDPITIELWHSNGTTIEDKLIQYGKDFERDMKAQGYNITVKITKNGSTYDELRTNVINALKGAKMPNIVQNYPDHVVEYNKEGAIISLAPYINSIQHGYDSNSDTERFTDILSSYRAEQRATNAQGDYISLPFNKSTEVVAYNKTMFDAVLVGQEFPETWQDLFEYSDQLIANKDVMIDQIARNWAAASSPLAADDIQKAKDRFVPFAYDSSGNAFITLVRQFGGEYTSRDSSGKGQLDFDNPQTKEMLKYFGEKRGKDFTIPPFWEAQYSNAVSLHGTTAFSVGSTGGIRYNTPVEKGYELYEIGVAPVPYDRFNPNRRSVIQQGTNMSITTQGTDQEKLASWYFLKYLTSSKIQADFGISTGYSPIRDSSYVSEEYETYLAKADVVMKKNFSEQGVTAAQYKTMYEAKVTAMGSKAASLQRNYQFFDQPFVGSSATRANVGEAFNRVMLAPSGVDLVKAINDAIEFAIAESLKSIS